MKTIEKLKEDIARGRVLIIAGTGVSIAACGDQKIEGHPVASWVGLLQHGLEECKRRKLVDEKAAKIFDAQIESGDTEFLVSAAEGISARLSKWSGVFRGWLQDTVGALEPKHPEILESLANLPCVIVTLNYDGLFEKATARREAVTWLRPDKVQKVVSGDLRNAIFHLHGYFDEPDSVVLGFASYAKVASDAHTSAILRSFPLTKTLLFVGCGGTVKDPNFSRLVEWAKDALKDVPPRHVLLCREEELDAQGADLGSAPWLEALAYGKGYEQLAPFLDRLAPPEGAYQQVAFPGASVAAPKTELPTKKDEPPTPNIEPPTLEVDAQFGNYPTLTAAVQAAEPGTRILVRRGWYKEEGVVIDKPLEILGDGNLGEVVIEAAGKDTILFKAELGRIANLTLRQAGEGEWYCVDIAQGRLNLEGCDITSQGKAGVAVHGGADPLLRRNHIHDCNDGGIFVYEDGQAMLEDNDIFGNRLAGVAIRTSGKVTLRRNRIYNGKRDGVFVWQNGQATLEDNEIFANSLPGVAMGKDGNLIMRRNRIYDGKREGVYVQDNGQATLENNEIFANGLAGVEIKTSGNAILRQNRISGNGSAAIRVYNEGGGVVEDNDLRGNTGGAWDISSDCLAKVKRARNQE
jgi:parallel beta-helix repeat protein